MREESLTLPLKRLAEEICWKLRARYARANAVAVSTIISDGEERERSRGAAGVKVR